MGGVEDGDERVVAVRAVASYRRSRYRGRPVRVCRYDACWPDGRITYDVPASRAVYRGSPADAETLARQVLDACPRIGVGPWIDDRGAAVGGPPEQRVPPGAGTGRPVPWPPTHRPVAGRSRPARVRLGLGAVGVLVLVGAVVLIRTSPTGALGFVGALCGIAGVVVVHAAVRPRH